MMPTRAPSEKKNNECLTKCDIAYCCTFGEGSTCMGWEGNMLSVSASMNKTNQEHNKEGLMRSSSIERDVYIR
jgi:hypothetical protein